VKLKEIRKCGLLTTTKVNLNWFWCYQIPVKQFSYHRRLLSP